jgi:FkbM family methyltransferase
MPTVEVDIDGGLMAKVEAYAAAKKTTVKQMLSDYLTTVAEDSIAIELPPMASQHFITMFRHQDRDTTVRFLAQSRWHEFEQPMPAYLFAWAHLAPGLVIDGGAGTGYYSLLAASASPDNQVLAFEPDPLVRGLLQLNIDANRFGGRIATSPAALSDSTGTGPLHVPSQDHGLIETSSSLESRFKARFSQVLDVDVTTLDDALARRGVDGQRVRIIKIDVAGHEQAVLDGAEQTVAEHRPVVFAEVLDRADFGALTHFNARHNYVDVPLRARSGELMAQGAVSYAPDAWNHALVPAEAFPRFLGAVRVAT